MQLGRRVNAARSFGGAVVYYHLMFVQNFLKKKSRKTGGEAAAVLVSVRLKAAYPHSMIRQTGLTETFQASSRLSRVSLQFPTLSGVCWDATSLEGWEQCKDSEEYCCFIKTNQPRASTIRKTGREGDQETEWVLIISEVVLIGRDDKSYRLNQLEVLWLCVPSWVDEMQEDKILFFTSTVGPEGGAAELLPLG